MIPWRRGSFCEPNRSKYDLMRRFTGVREDLAEWNRLSVKVGRGVICRFDRAGAVFYRRCKEGKAPGCPRFKPRHRWCSIEIPDPTPSMVSRARYRPEPVGTLVTAGQGRSPTAVLRQEPSPFHHLHARR